MLTIRNVHREDLPQLIKVEQLCFTQEEAATQDAFEQRIRTIPDSFFVAGREDRLIGLINGPVIEKLYITDDLFQHTRSNPPFGGYQSILGLAVIPAFQKRGVASALLNHLEKEAKQKERQAITLTCKEPLIPFYAKHGFLNKGSSASQHGDEVWFNMIKQLN
ncbi:GNAT family N-acetyltransferase [Pullulanibacillus sp. KACC 23026]|uniref:GNAT family N-acetyltransferase n=1 Tax=Pullulanibacillus sp. KACC 23026 TaxID=3028315 RepID=UPI0023B0EE44|nr:GNAT family N-acetyltransferase [Pullulanibacillus sp. KACC 23026]WEG10916.1 GNAT family N-acetyltransferase [Pullulanibacillus sp. KACC 23026]